MVTKKVQRKNALVRSQARYARAAMTIAPVTLDETHAAALRSITERTGESNAALVRRLLLDEAERRGIATPPPQSRRESP